MLTCIDYSGGILTHILQQNYLIHARIILCIVIIIIRLYMYVGCTHLF